MEIKGLQKTSLIDYPGNVCATIFTPGCNLRCPFCYNRDLVLCPESLLSFSREGILHWLQERQALLDGVCISGGEPTLQPGLVQFLEEIKGLGLKVKLDTNGTRPGVVEELLGKRLLDYVALDVKAPPEKYAYASGGRADLVKVLETVSLLRHSQVAHEFRTTVIPGLQQDDLERIACLLEGARCYVLQVFQPGNVLDPGISSRPLISGEALETASSRCRRYVQEVKIRGKKVTNVKAREVEE